MILGEKGGETTSMVEYAEREKLLDALQIHAARAGDPRYDPPSLHPSTRFPRAPAPARAAFALAISRELLLYLFRLAG